MELFSGVAGSRDHTRDSVLVNFAIFLIQCLRAHVLELDKVLVLAQLKEVHVLLPESLLLALVLVIADLIQDAKVSDVLLRIELLTYLLD